MFQDTYFINKTSGTFADNLATFGLAFVLDSIAAGRAAIRIEDRGAQFAVTCAPALRETWVDECAFFVGAPLLVTVDTKSGARMVKGTDLSPTDLEGMPDIAADYEQGKRDVVSFWEWMKSLTPEETKHRHELMPPVEPPADWDVFRAINPGALQTYNSVVAEWYRGRGAFSQLLRAVLVFASATPNNETGARAQWDTARKGLGLGKALDATASQLLNPAQGKGGNASKAVFAAPNNVKAFWVSEYLKVVGLRLGGVTKLINKKDRKTYALAPNRLDWRHHWAVMSAFKKAVAAKSGAIQLDALMSLRYARTLLKYVEEARDGALAAELFGAENGVCAFVRGMDTAFYKSLGNSVATMNIATIGLPRWVRPRSPEGLRQLSEALDEHIRIVRQFDETHGDQYAMLLLYRDFLSGNDISAFLDFTNSYSSFIIQRDKLAPQFTVRNLEVLMTNTQPKLGSITQSQGFRNLANAIRMATVEAQRRSLKKNVGKYPVRYETRYGLGPELIRKSAFRADFIEALSTFVQSYNAENARMRERMERQGGSAAVRGSRSDVAMQDIDDILRLMDEFGEPRMIASLLVAYGYASTYQRKDDTEPEAVTPEGEEPESGDADGGEEES